MSVTLPQAEASSVDTDPSSAIAGSMFLVGVVAGILGLLLIEGIVVGARRLGQAKQK